MHYIFVLVIIILALANPKVVNAKANIKSDSSVKNKNSNYRLPRNVVPESYKLTLEPDLEKFTFEGKSSITLNVKEKVSVIELNALDLAIQKATLLPANGKDELPGKIVLLEKHERAKFTFEKQIVPGKYHLELEFKGILNDKLRGFYRSHYKDNSGQKHWIATTQMEPTDARRMFPCFDEPDMKATYSMSVKIDSDLTAISNGRIVKIIPDKDAKKKLVEFETTPIMSTYLVAMIVGDFRSTKTKTACGVPIKVWALKGKEHLATYALDETVKVLEYQTKYFGIPYPSNKLDLIAIPDFRSGAMENLGAITFREARLLVDREKGSNFLKRSVVAVIAHEIAHQWFGDLVTMKWWDDIWLNEAFASWMGTKTVEATHPKWQELARAIITRNESMRIDELEATRAIHAEVTDPKQASEMFDGITYDKGESILWMLEGFVGEKPFQKGIQAYLNANKFGNAKSEDLWIAIGKFSSKPVPQIMKTWILQPGFPILTVGATKENGKLSLTQKRFFGLPELEVGDQTWNTPIVLRDLLASTDSNKKIAIQFEKRNQTFKIPGKWNLAFVNADGRGYYRVNYPSNLRSKILNSFSNMSTEEKLAYLSDVKALDKKGLIPVHDRLKLMMLVKNENDPLVQSSLIGLAKQPYHYLSESEYPAYEKLIKSLLVPLAKKVGWNAKEGETFSVKSLRTSVLSLLGTYGAYSEVVAQSRDLYGKYMADRSSIDPDIASTVLKIVAYFGNTTDYDQILAAYKKEQIPEHEKRLLSTLPTFRDPKLVDRTLKMVMSSDVRAQDGFGLLAHLLYSRDTNVQAWQFVKSNWSQVTKKFPGRSMSYIASACSSFDTPDYEKDLKAFYSNHELPAAKSSVSRMLETVHARVLYRKRNVEKIRAWIVSEAEKLN